MKSTNPVPPGYKHTKVGVIPEEWEVVKLGDVISSLEAGVSVNSEDKVSQKDEKGILKTSAVSNGKFIPDESKKIIEKEVSRARLNPKKGHILISRINTPELVGEICIVEKDFPNLYLPDRLWQASFHNINSINTYWLNYLLNFTKYKAMIKSLATGTSASMKNISKAHFLSIKIPLPPLKEQQKIARILGTWDEAIAKLEALIEEKERFKKGLMQKLLSVELRFPSFEGEWEEVRLGDVFTFIKSYSFSRKYISDDGDIGYIHYGDLHTKYSVHLDIKETPIPKINSDSISKEPEYLREGDIIIADASEDYKDIGKSVEIVNIGNHKLISGLHTFVLRDKNNFFVDRYKGYIFQEHGIKKKIKK